MPNLFNLPTRDVDGYLRAVIETPAGSSVKIRFDPEVGTFELARALVLGAAYPYDWGFLPSTRAPDGDPLDVLVYHDAPTFPGVLIPCRAIGVPPQGKRHRRERNDRVIAVPIDEERYSDARSLHERVRSEIEQFFVTSALMAKKGVTIEGWGGPEGGPGDHQERPGQVRLRRKDDLAQHALGGRKELALFFLDVLAHELDELREVVAPARMVVRQRREAFNPLFELPRFALVLGSDVLQLGVGAEG
jgi:inorganic pyrophosphatase